jgi:hypothetical protein
VNDAQNDPRFCGCDRPQVALAQLWLPLVASPSHGVIEVINKSNRPTNSIFTSKTQILIAMAGPAAIAIETPGLPNKVRQFERLKARASRSS